MQKANFRFEPIVEQDHIITAFGGAFREFALLVMQRFDFDLPKNTFGPLEEHWSKDKLTFTMESEAERNYWETALAMLKHECPQFFELSDKA